MLYSVQCTWYRVHGIVYSALPRCHSTGYTAQCEARITGGRHGSAACLQSQATALHALDRAAPATVDWTVLDCTVLHFIALYCTVLHCTTLYYTVLHCTALNFTALYCTVLHCTAHTILCHPIYSGLQVMTVTGRL